MLCRVLEKHTTGDASPHSFAQWPKWDTVNDYRLDGMCGMEVSNHQATWTYTDMPMVSHFWPPNGQISQCWPVLLPIQPSRLPILHNIAIFWSFCFHQPSLRFRLDEWLNKQWHLTSGSWISPLAEPGFNAQFSARAAQNIHHPLPWGNVKLTEQQLKLSILLVVNLFGHAWTRTMRTPACN